MKPVRKLWFVLPLALLWGAPPQRDILKKTAEAFLVRPYIQLGDNPRLSDSENMALLWHSWDRDADWRVHVKLRNSEEWRAMSAPRMRRIAMPAVEAHRVYQAALVGLTPGAKFAYQVFRNGEQVFSATARARRRFEEPHKFAVFGDCGAETPASRAISYQVFMAEPDFVFVPGDIVYSAGRISEYRAKFFPVYNSEEPDIARGAPLIRSTLMLAAPGNHDLANRNLGKTADLMAYFLYWAQPLNGPLEKPGAANTPVLLGPGENQTAFAASAGPNYPRMANFSFDFGNAHWTILDSNTYVDWTDKELRDWVARDLKSAAGAAWRFVGFHHPGFNSSRAHFNDQWMRVLSDVFEDGGVDIVFGGHVHNYQRSFPLRFTPKKSPDGVLVAKSGRVDGEWKIDKRFGNGRDKPEGVIYIVTGAGGARLYNPEQQSDPSTWQEFTAKFFSEHHSFSLVDVDGTKLTMRQIADDGRELDRFTVSK